MAREQKEVSVYRGRYHRTLGRALDDQGEVRPRKFLLGTNHATAQVANRLLEKLWADVIAEHEQAVRFRRELGGRLGDADAISGTVDLQQLRRLDHGPVWRAESLAIAEAIRQGLREIAAQPGFDADRPWAYVERIAQLRKTYSVIAFVPADIALYAAGQAALTQEARGLVAEAEDASKLAETPLPAATGQTLYQALDAYGRYAVQKNPKEAGTYEAACAQRLKASHPDVPLEKFGISSMEQISGYWAARPKGKKTGESVALSTVTNHLKVARRFVRWLHRTDLFKWTKPIDAEDALRVDVERLRTDAEVASLKDGVPVWSIGELKILYRYATDQERLLMLLALNCGFAHSEICSLRRDEIGRDGQLCTIRRIRRKNRVYGEFVLWAETVRAVEWFVAQDCAAGNPTHLMISQQGRTFDRQRIANSWNDLLDRVQRDHPQFRRLSFKYLRKTAGQLVRNRSDGEIAGVFLCHGRAVATDVLADVYTNRPFARVAAALQQVHADLQPLFAASPEAFSNPRHAESPNISRATIDLIRQLHREGKPANEIAVVVGVGREAVARWVGRDVVKLKRERRRMQEARRSG